MLFLQVFKKDFIRSIASKGFWLSVLGVAFLVTITAYPTISYSNTIFSILRNGVMGNGTEMVISCVLPIIPFSLSFAFEWHEKAIYFHTIRSGLRLYTISKLVVSCISGFLVLFFGITASIPFLKILAPQLPFSDPVYLSDDFFWSSLLAEGHAVSGFLIFIVYYSLAGCLTSVSGLCFSTYIPNPFAALAAPMALYYTLMRIDFLSSAEGWLRLSKLDFLSPAYWINVPYHTDSWLLGIGIKFVVILLLSILLGIVTIKQIKRRVLNA